MIVQGRRRILFLVLGIAAAWCMVFPVYWLVITSLKPASETFATPPTFWPHTLDLSSYTSNILHNATLGVYILNSLQLAVEVVVWTLLLSIPAAYALARLPIKGKQVATLVLLVLQMFPSIMLATPLFIVFTRLGLIDSLFAVSIAVSTRTISFTILVLRPFFLGLPPDLEEAAAVDGASRLGTLVRIILPISMPAVVTVSALNFLSGWGEFLFSLTLISSDTRRPLALGLYSYIGQYFTRWNDLMAVSVVASLPALVVLIAAQRYLVSGLLVGSTKG